MSRLDARYLELLGATTWKSAFEQASGALGVPSNSLKNLRDEFDTIHDNRRKGWHGRSMRPNRQRIADEFADVSDDALVEFTKRILARDTQATRDAIAVLVPKTDVLSAVAERLLTGRQAEEYFLQHSQRLVGHASDWYSESKESGRLMVPSNSRTESGTKRQGDRASIGLS